MGFLKVDKPFTQLALAGNVYGCPFRSRSLKGSGSADLADRLCGNPPSARRCGR